MGSFGMFREGVLEGLTVLYPELLVDRPPNGFGTITAIELTGSDGVLVGTSCGSVLAYGETETGSPGGNGSVFQALITRKAFVRRGVDQLCTVREHGLLLVLSSEGLVAVAGLRDLRAGTSAAMARLRGVSRLHWDEERGLLAVAAKRRLMLLSHDGADFALLKDLAVPEPPVAMEWFGNALCLGLRREYVVLNAATGAMSEVFPTGRQGPPSVLALPASGELLLARDNVGVFVGADGKASRKHSLAWSEPPVAMTVALPYVVAILPHSVEVRAVRPGAPMALVQSIPLEGLRMVAAPTPQQASVIVAASDYSVFGLCQVPLSEQIEELAGSGSFEAALALCELLDDPEAASATAEVAELRRALHGRFASALFAEGSYEAAMRHFTASDAPPLQVLRLFPSLLPPGPAGGSDGGGEVGSAAAAAADALGGARLLAALQALLPYLASTREAAWRRHAAAVAAATAAAGGPGAAAAAEVAAAEYSHLQLLDTAALKALVAAGGESDGLLRLLLAPNAVAGEEGERCLSEAGRYTELVALFRSRGRHRAALELLSRLGAAAAAAAAAATGPASAKAPPRFGPAAVVEYLLAMQPQDGDLILEFLPAVAALSGDAVLALLRRASPALPAARVLPLLQAQEPTLRIPYLEAELAARGAAHPVELHNALVLLCLEEVSIERAAAGASWDEASFSPARQRLCARLADPAARHAPERLLCRFPPAALLHERAALLSRLRRHGAALRLYVRRLRQPALAEAYCDRVWTRHGAAGAPLQPTPEGTPPARSEDGPPTLQPEPEPEPVEGEWPERDVYLALLTVYLGQLDDAADGAQGGGEGVGAPGGSDPAGEAGAPMLGEALSLLSRRGDRIDGSRVMGLLPGSIGLSVLLPFLSERLRTSRDERRQAAIARSLHRSRNLQARGALVCAREAGVLLRPEQQCALCPGRIGTAVFALFPDGTTAHYSCAQRAEQEGRVWGRSPDEGGMEVGDEGAWGVDKEKDNSQDAGWGFSSLMGARRGGRNDSEGLLDKMMAWTS